MSNSVNPIVKLINAVYGFLEDLEDHHLNSLLAEWPSLEGPMRTIVPRVLPVIDWLPEAANAADGRGKLIIEKLAAIANQIAWGQTYTAEDFGSGFLERYGWTELIGQRGPVASHRIACGFLILGPQIEYPRHSHEAEEVYVPLTGQTRWQQGQEKWVCRPAGRPIYHAPRVPHAMRTEGVPLLAVYLWRGADLTEKSRIE